MPVGVFGLGRRRAERDAVEVFDVFVELVFRQGAGEGGGGGAVARALGAGAREGERTVGALAEMNGVGVDEESEVDLSASVSFANFNTKKKKTRTLDSHETRTTANAKPFSWFQMSRAASARCSFVSVGPVICATAIKSSCACELAWRAPSCGVCHHHRTAKYTVHEVEST